MITLSPACASLEHPVTCGFVLQVWTAAMLCAAHQLLLLLDHTGGGVQEPCPMLAHSSLKDLQKACLLLQLSAGEHMHVRKVPKAREQSHGAHARLPST